MPTGEFRPVVRFILVGLINTVFGYMLFWAFFIVGRLSAPISNALSYLMATVIAFFLYRRFVFGAPQLPKFQAVVIYAVSSSVAFSLNLLVLSVLIGHGVNALLAQIWAMVSFTTCFYLLNRFVVFRFKA